MNGVLTTDQAAAATGLPLNSAPQPPLGPAAASGADGFEVHPARRRELHPSEVELLERAVRRIRLRGPRAVGGA